MCFCIEIQGCCRRFGGGMNVKEQNLIVGVSMGSSNVGSSKLCQMLPVNNFHIAFCSFFMVFLLWSICKCSKTSLPIVSAMYL